MLGGRALSRKIFPLSTLGTGADLSLQQALRYGQLPMTVTASFEAEKIDYLDAYVETYLKEEVQQEALTRNLDSFFRFLQVTLQSTGSYRILPT